MTTMAERIRRRMFGIASFGPDLIEAVRLFGMTLAGPASEAQLSSISAAVNALRDAVAYARTKTLTDSERAANVRHEVHRAIQRLEREIQLETTPVSPESITLDKDEEHHVSKLRSREWLQCLAVNDLDLREQLVLAKPRYPLRILIKEDTP